MFYKQYATHRPHFPQAARRERIRIHPHIGPKPGSQLCKISYRDVISFIVALE